MTGETVQRNPPVFFLRKMECVDTNPHMHTNTNTGPRASEEDQRNTLARAMERVGLVVELLGLEGG